ATRIILGIYGLIVSALSHGEPPLPGFTPHFSLTPQKAARKKQTFERLTPGARHLWCFMQSKRLSNLPHRLINEKQRQNMHKGINANHQRKCGLCHTNNRGIAA
ncbi:MAG: hypothetical protein ACRC0C_01725, partial [Gibbsiella quercinecans]|uniref:hypothetical protein n=1 Tax=Gibbsiella quercinecans TaxID=929813 RepID=UPI003F337E8E